MKKNILLLMLSLSCIPNNNNKNEKLLKQKEILIGQNLDFTKTLDFKKENKFKFIYFYSGNDCVTCIDNGFKTIKDNFLETKNLKIVATNSNISQDQLRNAYKEYIFEDTNNSIRKELKYIYTPVFIKLDTNNQIKDIYYSTLKRDIKAEKNFFNN